MFFAAFQTIDHEPQAAIYHETPGGYAEYHRDTWSPETEILSYIPLHVSGRTYRERQKDARKKAVEFSWIVGTVPLSYGELDTMQEFFEIAGRRYGLLQEFRENAIC